MTRRPGRQGLRTGGNKVQLMSSKSRIYAKQSYSLTQLTSSQPAILVSGVVTTSGLARMAHMLNSVRYLRTHSGRVTLAVARTLRLRKSLTILRSCYVVCKFSLDVALIRSLGPTTIPGLQHIQIVPGIRPPRILLWHCTRQQ